MSLRDVLIPLNKVSCCKPSCYFVATPGKLKLSMPGCFSPEVPFYPLYAFVSKNTFQSIASSSHTKCSPPSSIHNLFRFPLDEKRFSLSLSKKKYLQNIYLVTLTLNCIYLTYFPNFPKKKTYFHYCEVQYILVRNHIQGETFHFM